MIIIMNSWPVMVYFVSMYVLFVISWSLLCVCIFVRSLVFDHISFFLSLFAYWFPCFMTVNKSLTICEKNAPLILQIYQYDIITHTFIVQSSRFHKVLVCFWCSVYIQNCKRHTTLFLLVQFSCFKYLDVLCHWTDCYLCQGLYCDINLCNLYIVK